MLSSSALFRSLLIYGLCLPLAILLGYLLADPLNYTTVGTIGLILFLLVLPLLLRWHHAWLIAVWNTNMIFTFLPGHPPAWLMITGISFMISTGRYILNRRLKFLHVPSIVRPLIFLVVVVFATAKLTGGLGLRFFGDDSYGGKRYFFIYAAVLGYFALTSQQIPVHRRIFFVTLFLLGWLTFAIGSLAILKSSIFQPLFLFFPPDVGGMSFGAETVSGRRHAVRLGGLAVASSAVVFAMMARYGIREILTIRRPLRLLIFVVFGVLSLFGGFRSFLIQMVLVFSVVFYMEGLVRSKLMPILALVGIFGGTIMLPFVDRLPLSIQRSVSFLPLSIDPEARMDAEASSEWRLQMWRNVAPQIPQYLIIGKGYSFSGSDMEMGQAAPGIGGTEAQAALVGDYHNGPLSIILPFGIFGVAGFIWFIAAGIQAMYRNYIHGDPELRKVNRFLLAFMLVKLLMFLAVFGSFHSDLAAFTGLIGLSISLNGGVAKPVPVIVPKSSPGRRRLPAGKKAIALGHQT